MPLQLILEAINCISMCTIVINERMSQNHCMSEQFVYDFRQNILFRDENASGTDYIYVKIWF